MAMSIAYCSSRVSGEPRSATFGGRSSTWCSRDRNSALILGKSARERASSRPWKPLPSRSSRTSPSESLGLGRAVRHPDVGGGAAPEHRHVLDHADHPEALAVGLDVPTGGWRFTEETPAGGLADHRDEVAAAVVLLGEGAPFEEIETEGSPSRLHRCAQAGDDLLAVDEAGDVCAVLEDRHLLHPGDVPA